MYDGKSQLLVKNPINRYLINSPMLSAMKKDADSSLTLYLQKDSPGADKETNWLPAPDDKIYLVMRLYWKVWPDKLLGSMWWRSVMTQTPSMARSCFKLSSAEPNSRPL